MSPTPTHYSLEIEPDLEAGTFCGRAQISVWCDEPTSQLELDAADLQIQSCHVLTANKTLEAEAVMHGSKEALAICIPKEINGGCIIDIQYTGTLNDRLLGFYRSRFSHNSKTEYLATTQFEAADARRAFPCWDEPNYKATFDVVLVAPPGTTAISNMPIAYTKKRGDETVYHFKRTPKMSTYLLYLGVGKFEYREGKTKKSRIRIVTTPGKSWQGEYAQYVAERLLTVYEHYFKRPYPLPKLDLIALPDFAAGAMENWGAITFRENILLYDPKNSSTHTQQLIAEVISHELAHQWFGNLVTMDWWNDLWLNEGFATFMATKMVDMLYPQWRMWDQFVDMSMEGAMRMDSLHSTHPIDVEVESPSQIREIFDAISYNKGACVLRMLEDMVGKVAFRNGLRLYLGRFKYRNATTNDLWECIEQAYRSDVRNIAESWLKQDGFPVLDVTSTAFRLEITQERFYADGQTESNMHVWPIPVRHQAGRRTEIALFTDRTAVQALPRRFVANHNRVGFYRVQYRGLLFDEIKGMIKRREVTPRDRWGVQNDLFAFCLSGRVSLSDYLDIVDAYAEDTAYLPVSNIGRNLVLLLNISAGHRWASIVQTRALPFFRDILNRIGREPSDSDSHTDTFLRAMAIRALSRMDNDVADWALSVFKKMRQDISSVHPDIRAPMLVAAAHNGGPQLLDQMKNMFSVVDSIEEKTRVLEGMCGFDAPALLQQTLDFTLTDHVRSQNVYLPIHHVGNNPYGGRILWPWVKNNWESLRSKIGVGNPLLGRVISSLTLATTSEDIPDICKFYDVNPAPGTERTLAQTLEMISIYDNFRKRTNTQYD